MEVLTIGICNNIYLYMLGAAGVICLGDRTLSGWQRASVYVLMYAVKFKNNILFIVAGAIEE